MVYVDLGDGTADYSKQASETRETRETRETSEARETREKRETSETRDDPHCMCDVVITYKMYTNVIDQHAHTAHIHTYTHKRTHTRTRTHTHTHTVSVSCMSTVRGVCPSTTHAPLSSMTEFWTLTALGRGPRTWR